MRAPQIGFAQLVQDFFLRRLVAERCASAPCRSATGRCPRLRLEGIKVGELLRQALVDAGLAQLAQLVGRVQVRPLLVSRLPGVGTDWPASWRARWRPARLQGRSPRWCPGRARRGREARDRPRGGRRVRVAAPGSS